MANDIKGITIKIGGDTTGLTDALKGVNSTAESAKNELKEVNKALKLDPGNTELLEQKQRALAAAVQATAEKLNVLKEAQKQAADQLARKEIGQEQYDALQREIIQTEAELKKATKAQQEFNATAEQVKTAMDGISSKAEKVAQATKGLSTAAAGLLVSLGGAALKTAVWADDLNSLSKQTGITTEDLQKMQYAADLVDVSVDTIAGSMSKMRKAMVADNKADVFAQLGVNVRDMQGNLRDSSEVFYEVLEALGKVGNETERDTLAMEIFGKSADQLAGIIDDGGASLKALGEEAENLGIIMDQETLDALNKVNDSIDRLKATAKGELAKAGASALEALTPVLESVVAALSEILEAIGNIDPETMKIIMVVLAIVAAISPVASIIATITGAISTLTTVLPILGTAIGAVSLPMVAAVAGAVALGVAAAKLADLIYTNWDKIKEKFSQAKDFVVSIFEAIVQLAKDKINAVIDFINKGIDAINALTSKINNSLVGKFLGINIGTIGNIPALAGGGSLAGGTALIGENGPELLTMSNGRANVTPLQKTTNTYNTINQTSRQPVQINLVLDGMVAARALYDPLKTVGQQRGPSFVTE